MAVTRMEPTLPAETKELTDLATDLVAKASGLAARLSPALRTSVGALVRSMNCYYSNLIENHNTTLIDIDRALKNDFAKEPEKRNLQLEAKAHIEVQEMIDRGEGPGSALSVNFIRWLHQEFYTRVPDDMWWVENPQTNERLKMMPGELVPAMSRSGSMYRPTLPNYRCTSRASARPTRQNTSQKSTASLV